MQTPLTKLGTLRPLADGWEALIRIDDRGTRRGFALLPFSRRDEDAARERCNAMALLAVRIRRAGKAWDAVVAAADQLCAGTTEPLSEAARVTIAELGRDWRSAACVGGIVPTTSNGVGNTGASQIARLTRPTIMHRRCAGDDPQRAQPGDEPWPQRSDAGHSPCSAQRRSSSADNSTGAASSAKAASSSCASSAEPGTRTPFGTRWLDSGGPTQRAWHCFRCRAT